VSIAWHDRGVIDVHDALELEAIRRAQATMDPVFLGSPQFVHEGLSARAPDAAALLIITGSNT